MFFFNNPKSRGGSMNKKMHERRELAKKIWGEKAEEVVDFLEKEAPKKKEFMNEKSIINYTSRALLKKLKVKSKDEECTDFWSNRIMSLKTTEMSSKPKNIIYIIRLLNGKAKVPDQEEPEYDFKLDTEIPEDDEERFWEAKEKEREGWIY